jgi:hypothetical protein
MKARIFLHPGMGEGEPHYLDRVGTMDDLARSRLVLTEGMILTFYDYDASEKSDDDKLLFEGAVHYDSSRQKWYALIDWASFRHESDERGPIR